MQIQIPGRLRVFFTGMFISFLGTLPLGTLNVSAMQISVSDGIRPAIYFALGALLVEMAYVRLSLVAMDWVRRHRQLLKALEWATLMMIAALSVASFYAATQPGDPKNPILSNTLHRFWLGALMSAVNPLQVPFWFGWSTVLFSRGVLRSNEQDYLYYITGIGLGTLVGNGVFIFGGQLMTRRLADNQHTVHLVIGAIFALTAIIQGWKMLRHTDAISRMPDKG